MKSLCFFHSKNYWLLLAILVGFLPFAQAQKAALPLKVNGYEFTIDTEIDATGVKNQNRSNTCWSFATLSFLESELMRMGKGTYDFSEMYIVRNTYVQKAERYVRMHGQSTFAGGGAFHDAIKIMGEYGLVPESVYDGIEIDSDQHLHGELDVVLKAIVDAVIQNKNKALSNKWLEAYAAVLDTYLGTIPTEFEYDGKTYTPEKFAKKLELDPDNYIELSSFSHHPYYEEFVLEVPDNWSWETVQNLPLDELIETIDHALENGYSIAWGGDVSEEGFSFRHGLAVVPAVPKFGGFDSPTEEVVITEEMRQAAFDNYSTQDDHAMHITGIAHDQNGTKYYLIKNSWGDGNRCGGYLYASEAYIRYKTTAILLHKEAIPKKISKKLGF